jgi:predicted DNA-binding transcriptional regulator AlpA
VVEQRSNTRRQEDDHPRRFDILTPRGAAEYLGGILSEAALQRYRSEGGGPKFIKIGKRRVGYRLADLQAWLDARVAQSTADARARGLAA